MSFYLDDTTNKTNKSRTLDKSVRFFTYGVVYKSNSEVVNASPAELLQLRRRRFNKLLVYVSLKLYNGLR